MERKELRDRLHLSGIDGQAAALAGKWRLGFEIAEFCWAPRLEQPDAMELVRQQIAGVERLWLHAPFAELAPCAIDPLVREAALRRFRQTIRTARMLGVKRIVVHGGYIPLVYFPEWYVEQSAVFWKELLADVPPDMVLAVENVMEPGPDMLVQIAEQVNDPRLGLCLDVGHANLPPITSRPRQHLRQQDAAHGVDRSHGPVAEARTPAQQQGGLGSPRPAGTGGHPHGTGAGHAAGRLSGGDIYH